VNLDRELVTETPVSDYFEDNPTGEVEILHFENGICIEIDGARIDELRTLLSRGLNTWERAPEWLLKLAEIVG
jgi:hypothetical protein